MPTLVVKYKDGSRSYPLREGVPVFIGRARECDVHLPYPAVSRRHAVVIFKNGICGVKDLGSFNGTIVNGKTITAAQHLTDADVMQISTFLFRIDMSDIAPGFQEAPAAGPAEPAPLSGDTVLLPRGKPPPAPGEAPSPGDDAREDRSAESRRLRGDSRTFPNSRILLPRAMVPQGDVDRLLEDLPDAPSGAGAAGGADSTVEVSSPAEFARSLAREAQRDVESILPDAPAPAEGRKESSGGTREQTRFDTGYFRGEAPPPREEDVEAPAGGDAPEDAESLIPMSDHESSPQLTLNWDDDETSRALEALVEDVSQDVDAFRSGQSGGDAADFPPEIDPAGRPETGFSAGADAAEPEQEPEQEPEASEADETVDAFTPVKSDRDTEIAFDSGSVADPDQNLPTSDGTTFSGQAAVPGLEALVLTPSFMTAINARLSLYSLLLDLAEERNQLRMDNPALPPDVESELARQDAEVDSLPSAEEADRFLSALAKRRAQLAATEQDARENGLPLPVSRNVLLARAEEMAESQWMLVRDSNRETLPAVYKEAYKLSADEPLAQDFTAARINHGRLFGGALYLLALESIAETARAERRNLADQIRTLSEKGLSTKESSGLLARLADAAGKVRDRTEIREETLRLEELDREQSIVEERAMREYAFMEKTLIREFRQVFAQAATHFVPKDEMPLAVRAFLRYGVIGFKSWWMTEEARKFIQRDCRKNIVAAVEVRPGSTTVLYADEYLAAVANMEASPFPDETFAGKEKNPLERRTDSAYRRIVNANSYNILLEDMLARLDARVQEYDDKALYLDQRIGDLTARPSPKTADTLFGLQTSRQAIAIRKENMQKHIKRIEKEVVASILDSVEAAEGRFRRGELRMPDAGALAAKEAESLAEIAKRIGGSRQTFMPMAVRRHFAPDELNGRESVEKRLREMEKADPGVFVNVIVPAKKRENRVELRLSPVVMIVPGIGTRGLYGVAMEGMEGGHIAVPMCFTKADMAESAFAWLLADFRWEASRMIGRNDLVNSDTAAGAFMRFRWEWRSEPKARREKGFIFNDLSDKRNWRRVYAVYLADRMYEKNVLVTRNPALYESVIEPYLNA